MRLLPYAAIAAVLLSACAPPVKIRASRPLPPPPVSGPDDTAGEGEGDTAVDPPPVDDSLELRVRFREPGQHVVLNAQAGDTVGDLHLVTLPSEDVGQPFALDDDATEGALFASAHLDVAVDTKSVVVGAFASYATDVTAYVVGQAGPLPLEVCALSSEATAVVHLRCEGTLSVDGAGIAAINAASDGDTLCNGVDLDEDRTLIPWHSPTDVERVLPVVDGAACWPVDVYAGANSDDEFSGSGDVDATFTFTASAG